MAGRIEFLGKSFISPSKGEFISNEDATPLGFENSKWPEVLQNT
jgi:hypothetical protein